MKQVSDTLHLQKRGDVWHYCRRVPQDIVHIIGKRFIKCSLRTTSRNDAKNYRTVEELKAEAQFSAAYDQLKSGGTSAHGMAPASVAVLTEHVRSIVERCDSESAKRLAIDPATSSDELEDLIYDAEYELDILKQPDDPRQKERIISFGRRILKEAQCQIDDDGAEFEFSSIVRRALVELAKRRIARLTDTQSQQFFDHLFDTSQAPAITFSDMVKTYLSERKAEIDANGVSPRRYDNLVGFTEALREIVGDAVIIGSIDDDVVQRVRATLATMPANRNKIYPKLTLDQAIAQGAKDGKRTLSPVSQSSYLTIFRAILAVAVRKKWLSYNPAGDVRPLQKDTISPSEKRFSLSPQQVRDFFMGKFYRSCAPDAPEPYGGKDRAWRFWLPLIMLFSGARPREIVQLHISDVKRTEAGVLYLDFTADGITKKLKTHSSRRRVPLHPELVRIGFLQFVEARRTSAESDHGPLFHELKAKKSGNPADYACRRFREKFLPDEIVLGCRQTFYSLRHTVRDALRRVEAPADALLAITGWAPGEKSVADDYGDPGNPDFYKKWVDKIDYTGLDLSFLYPTQG